MRPEQKTLIEVAYLSESSLPCLYMEQALQEVLPRYEHLARYRRIDLTQESGKKRFLELSVSLYGEEAVYKKARLAPVPSLFLDGELCFDAVPPSYELEAALEKAARLKREGTGPAKESVL